MYDKLFYSLFEFIYFDNNKEYKFLKFYNFKCKKSKFIIKKFIYNYITSISIRAHTSTIK